MLCCIKFFSLLIRPVLCRKNGSDRPVLGIIRFSALFILDYIDTKTVTFIVPKGLTSPRKCNLLFYVLGYFYFCNLSVVRLPFEGTSVDSNIIWSMSIYNTVLPIVTPLHFCSFI
jgi:hypothetical protein